jgi:hypothetical protein
LKASGRTFAGARIPASVCSINASRVILDVYTSDVLAGQENAVPRSDQS